jgi:hypothetical protein
MGVAEHRTFDRRSNVPKRTIAVSNAPVSCSEFDEMHRLRGRCEVVVRAHGHFGGVRKY